MERIIGGIKQKYPFPVCKTHRLLWPCFEFIAYVDGLDNYEKNILDEIFLKLAKIGVTCDEEIGECTALETDTISFMQSRLQQKGLLDEAYHITEEGEKVIEKLAEKRSIPVYVYVDALTGRIVPHITPTSWKKDDEFNYESPHFTKDEKSGALLFSFRSLSASTGTERDEVEDALVLSYYEQYEQHEQRVQRNMAPSGNDVTAMLHRLYPNKEGLYARVDPNQDTSTNLCWIMLDLLLPEGDTQHWVCTDGFGSISTFFSVDPIKVSAEVAYITNLRSDLKNETNAVDGHSAQANSLSPYNKIVEKYKAAGRCFLEMKKKPKSPDEEKEWIDSRNNAFLYTEQLAEWTLSCMLTSKDYEIEARQQLDIFKDYQPNHIAATATNSAKDCGFDFCAKNRLVRGYRQVEASFRGDPVLVAILDLALCTFRGEPWFKKFAQEHRDFISRLLQLNDERNDSFHSGEAKMSLEFLESMREDIRKLLLDGLGVKLEDDGKISFAHINAKRAARLMAISRMEMDLGFALSHILDPKLIQFYIKMESRSPKEGQVENDVVLNMYQVLERVFVLANERLDDSLKNSLWNEKAKSAGFKIDEGDCDALFTTRPQLIAQAMKRGKSSMNAACIVFFTLAEKPLLLDIKSIWPTMLADISYIVWLRGHGEIPREIDKQRVWGIKANIKKIIKFLAQQGYLA